MLKTIATFAFLLLLGFTNAQAQTNWAGTYTFEESGGQTAGGTNIFIGHELKITQKNGKLTAHLTASGYQTSEDIYATAKTEGSKLMIYFERAGENQIRGNYNAGDLLLTLERKTVKGKPRLLTYWNAYSPGYESNQVSGKVYFRKIK